MSRIHDYRFDSATSKPKTVIVHTQISDPVTKKTERQRQQIAEMKVISNPEGERKEANFQTSRPVAFQMANAAIADLLALDDRLLPAQTRKTIAPTAKNAYVYRHKIEFGDEELGRKGKGALLASKATLLALRSGSLVYIGKGANDVQRLDFTKEIVQQFKQAMLAVDPNATNLHFNFLISDSTSENQDVMLAITEAVVRSDPTSSFVHTPMNFLGSKTQAIRASENVEQKAQLRTGETLSLQKNSGANQFS